MLQPRATLARAPFNKYNCTSTKCQTLNIRNILKVIGNNKETSIAKCNIPWRKPRRRQRDRKYGRGRDYGVVREFLSEVEAVQLKNDRNTRKGYREWHVQIPKALKRTWHVGGIESRLASQSSMVYVVLLPPHNCPGLPPASCLLYYASLC